MAKPHSVDAIQHFIAKGLDMASKPRDRFRICYTNVPAFNTCDQVLSNGAPEVALKPVRRQSPAGSSLFFAFTRHQPSRDIVSIALAAFGCVSWR